MDTISSHVRVPISSSCIFASPTPVKWACDSISPGIAKRPARSITRVFSPTCAWISWLVPTAAMRSPRTAIAWTDGRVVSAVATTPLVNTRSAGSTRSAPPAQPSARTDRHEAARVNRRTLLRIVRFSWGRMSRAFYSRRTG